MEVTEVETNRHLFEVEERGRDLGGHREGWGHWSQPGVPAFLRPQPRQAQRARMWELGEEEGHRQGLGGQGGGNCLSQDLTPQDAALLLGNS